MQRQQRLSRRQNICPAMLSLHLSKTLSYKLTLQGDLDSELEAAAAGAEPLTSPKAAAAAAPVKTLDLGADAGWGGDEAAAAVVNTSDDDSDAGEEHCPACRPPRQPCAFAALRLIKPNFMGPGSHCRLKLARRADMEKGEHRRSPGNILFSACLCITQQLLMQLRS